MYKKACLPLTSLLEINNFAGIFVKIQPKICICHEKFLPSFGQNIA